MGEVVIPGEHYWGAQTERARQNFIVSDFKIPPLALGALATIKQCAARVNRDLGLLEPHLAAAIEQAALEIREGRFAEEFPLDVFQTGSGTSWNMNINEVIASRANEILGQGRGGRTPVHPNDHVNKGQSSNDVIPSVLHIADRLAAVNLADALKNLAESLRKKAAEYDSIIKIGRTHLQDAVPMTVSQELGSWASQIDRAGNEIMKHFPALNELALGGTAIGSGLNTHPEFGARVCRELETEYSVPFTPAKDLFEAISSRDVQVGLMGSVAQAASALMKISGDMRLLASGPRSGFGELILPPLQPGSSIMPGKINPVIPEMVIQAGAFVLGVQTSVAVSNQFATLQLNVMLPLLIHQTVTSMEILAKAIHALDELCVRDLKINLPRMEAGVEWSLALVTPLAEKLGYDRAAELAYIAVNENLTIREVCLRDSGLSEIEINMLLNPETILGSFNKQG